MNFPVPERRTDWREDNVAVVSRNFLSLPAAAWLRVCFNGRRRTLLPATLGSRSRPPMVAPLSAANRKTRPR